MRLSRKPVDGDIDEIPGFIGDGIERTGYRPIAILAGALLLSACSATQQAKLSAIGAWIAAAEQKINANVAPTFQDVCMGIGVLGTAFTMVAPALGASSADLADGQLGIQAGNALCAKTPTDIGTAVAQGLTVYKTIKDATEAAAPGALAAAAAAAPKS